MIQKQFSPTSLVGFDPSTQAIARAKRDFGSPSIKFTSSTDQIPKLQFDLAYCNGVFHHILPADRSQAFQTVWDSLKPGGYFAFWENNPWNPGTRYVMSKIPFDRDAIVISPRQAQVLLSNAGFEIVACHSRFLFPRSLSWLRPIENLFYRLPIGAQYLVLARKPSQ